MELSFIPTRGTLYEGECDLRFHALREPLGMGRDTVRFEFEDESLHLVAHRGDRVLGCVLFFADGQGGGRLFQMAVDPSLQGQGMGRILVEHLEDRLRADGIKRVILHARDHAIGFYERLGYVCFGEPYEEVGIPHRHMHKSLP
jgi:ribosomal protein S18 acetylase RimI-like enzyme